jgi:hypothetical protein
MYSIVTFTKYSTISLSSDGQLGRDWAQDSSCIPFESCLLAYVCSLLFREEYIDVAILCN